MIRITVSAIAALILAGATMLIAPSAQAQQQKALRVRGTIEQVNGTVLSVKARDGALLQVKMTGDVKVVALVKASLADIKPGSFVGSTAMPQQDGHWKAVEVHIFPEAMRGTGEGDRPNDFRPKSTMTNGTVENQTSGTVGENVANASGRILTLTFKEGEKKIEVVPETVIYTYAAGSKDELRPGAVVTLAANRQADGTLTAARVNVGRNVAPPM